MIQKLNIGTTLAALILFFLPWIDIRCSGESIATQTGIQTIYGGGTPPANAGSPEPEATEKPEINESLGFAILVGLALLAVIAAVAISFLAFRSGDGKLTNLVGFLCATALVLLIAQATIGFPVKESISESIEGHSETGNAADDFGGSIAGAMMSGIEIDYRPAFYLELLMLGLPTLVLANGLLDRMKKV